ncbi:MAG TPA: helix-turn-helix domain-containing protein [Hyphomonadaceae bacterium]|nr:helix-turn-helix domain-containing protein [Hyphomonadaceae bacterium]
MERRSKFAGWIALTSGTLTPSRSSGRRLIGVSDLAQKAGLGIRQFERRFRDEIGIAPKLYARIVRFETALRRKTAAPATRWTDIAHSLGYHDQMHMVHDFNRLSGDSPTVIGGRLDMFVQPEIASGPAE